MRNVTRLNPGIWPRPVDERYDWEIFAELCQHLAIKVKREYKPLPPTAQLIEGMLARGAAIHGVTLAALGNAPHGIDLGPLKPSLYQRLETPDGKINCAPAVLLADIVRFSGRRMNGPEAASNAASGLASGSFTLIGRRHVRSNNSWMHNSHRLIKGKRRDQLMMHPDDVASIGAHDGQTVEVRAAAGSVQIAVQATDTLMRGVVSLPHGWGHQRSGTRLGLAAQYPGVSYNDLSSGADIDTVSGNAALNGIPVAVIAIASQPMES